MCLCAIARVGRPITFPSCTSNEAHRNTALPWFGSCRNESKPWRYACEHMHTQTHTHTHKHKCVFVYSNSSVHFGGLHEWLHKVFSRWWQLLCLAGEDVTKILILDKQIATDSLTGQNLQVNRIKNSSIDSNKQIATNWLTWAQPVSKQNSTTQIRNGGAISQRFVMCRFRFAD